MYFPSLHFYCCKLAKFLTTYPPLSANMICKSSLIDIYKFINTLQEKKSCPGPDECNGRHQQYLSNTAIDM